MWPARGQKRKVFYKCPDAWLDGRDESLVNNLDCATTLPRDLCRRDDRAAPDRQRPPRPATICSKLTSVQEGVTFFKAKGSQYPALPCESR